MPTVHNLPLIISISFLPFMIDDIKFLLDRDAGFSYFPSRGTLVVMFYRDFRAFMDSHLGKAKETTKTESN